MAQQVKVPDALRTVDLGDAPQHAAVKDAGAERESLQQRGKSVRHETNRISTETQ